MSWWWKNCLCAADWYYSQKCYIKFSRPWSQTEKKKVFCLADFLFLELATEIETNYWKQRNCHHIAQSKTCNFNEQGNNWINN